MKCQRMSSGSYMFSKLLYGVFLQLLLHNFIRNDEDPDRKLLLCPQKV